MNLDLLLGNAVRKIPSQEKALYLTFDDGPDLVGTGRVLEVLSKNSVKATFFVIAEKAKKNLELLRKIQSLGHSIGNHSLDHHYRHFFRGRRGLIEWVKKSEDLLSDLTGAPTVGFRPPVGIRTPELKWAVRELQIPLVLWDIRFYDTAFPKGSILRNESATGAKPDSDTKRLQLSNRANRVDSSQRGMALLSTQSSKTKSTPLGFSDIAV